MIFGVTPELPTIDPKWGAVKVWSKEKTIEEYAASGLPIQGPDGSINFSPRKTILFMLQNDPEQFFILAKKNGVAFATSDRNMILKELSERAQKDENVRRLILKIWTMFIPQVTHETVDDYYVRLIRSMDYWSHRIVQQNGRQG